MSTRLGASIKKKIGKIVIHSIRFLIYHNSVYRAAPHSCAYLKLWVLSYNNTFK